jgi:hypothetical protein
VLDLIDLIEGGFQLVVHWRFGCGLILAALVVAACYAFLPDPWNLIAAIPLGGLYAGGGSYFECRKQRRK